jgi:TRAP-type C4-dicarboxylate transport system substrate-binding protein
MSKKIYLVVISIALILALVSSLILSSCSSTPTTVTSTTVQTATATATSVQTSTATSTATTTTTLQPIVLKFLDQYAPGTAAANQSELLGKSITDATQGRVQFTYFHAESLGKAPDFLTLLNGGVTDVVNVTPGAYPAQFDVETYFNLPGIGIFSRTVGIDVLWSLYNKGYLSGVKNFKVLAFNPTPPFEIFTKQKVNSVADLKGLKIRTGDPIARKFLDQVGAVGTSMTSSEVYMAIDRGTLDGTMTAEEFMYNTKMYEVAKNGIISPKIAIGSVFIIMNKGVWDKIPADVQANIEKGIEVNKTAFPESVKAIDAGYPDQLKAKGMTLVSFTAEESTKLLAGANSIKADWITQYTAKGVPAQAIADLVASVVAKYK